MKAVPWLALGATLALGASCHSPALAQGSFSDVPSLNLPPYDSVRTLAAEGILGGYPDGTFGGRLAMTRWEFALALWRTVMRVEQKLREIRGPNAPGRPLTALPNPGLFADVPTDSSLGDLLRHLGARGIIQGYPDQTFAARRPVTQDESRAALQRTLQWVDRELSAVMLKSTGAPLPSRPTPTVTGPPVRPAPARGSRE